MIRRKRTAVTISLLLCAGLIVLFGCTVMDEKQLNASGTGMIRIELTDAPLLWKDVKEFHVFIERIEVHSYLGDWQTLIELGQDYDLLKLRNGASATLGIREINAGYYSGMRLVLGGNHWIHLDDGITLQRINLKLARNESAQVMLMNNFEMRGKSTATVTVDFDAEKSLVNRETSNLLMEPFVKTVWNEHEGSLVFYDDFGIGTRNNKIEGWIEHEHISFPYKCTVEDGSPLGGRYARLYGKDLACVNHYFAKQLDLSPYQSGTITFWARSTDDWSIYDRVYMECFYDGAWHPMHVFRSDDWKSGNQFKLFEMELTEEMMSLEFWVRFRNGLWSYDRCFDVDNFSIYVQK